MTKILLVSDVHGGFFDMREAIVTAVDHEVDLIIQLGDFGVWPGEVGQKFLSGVNKLLKRAHLECWVIPGNHEDYNQIEKLPTDERGFGILRSNLFTLPRGYGFDMDGWKFVVCGGAVSIDRAWRTKDVSWWPQETISAADEDAVLAHDYADIFLTHDCSPQFPKARFQLQEHFESDLHNKIMGRMAEHLKPVLWMHGHMHIDTEYAHQYYTERDGKTVQDLISVISLNCNRMYGWLRLLELDGDVALVTHLSAKYKAIQPYWKPER